MVLLGLDTMVDRPLIVDTLGISKVYLVLYKYIIIQYQIMIQMIIYTSLT